MPKLQQSAVLDVAGGVRAYLRFEVGIIRGEVTRQTTGPPARAACLQRPGDLQAKGAPRRRRQRCHRRRYPSRAFHLGLRRSEDRQ